MDLVEVDEVGLEPAQRSVAGLQDVLAAEPATVGSRTHRAVDLGREHDLVARDHLPQPAPGYLFARAVGVDVRGVEEVDSGLERCGEVFARLLARDDPLAPSLVAIAHASKADMRNAEARFTELGIFHFFVVAASVSARKHTG